jgi:hypothetical protein
VQQGSNEKKMQQKERKKKELDEIKSNWQPADLLASQ